jgi:hypothetical protein
MSNIVSGVYDGGSHTPKLLPCSHTVCLECLSHIASSQTRDTGSFRCPICRELITIPRGGVAALPPSFLVNQLLDLMSRQRREVIPKCSVHINQVLKSQLDNIMRPMNGLQRNISLFLYLPREDFPVCFMWYLQLYVFSFRSCCFARLVTRFSALCAPGAATAPADRVVNTPLSPSQLPSNECLKFCSTRPTTASPR